MQSVRIPSHSQVYVSLPFPWDSHWVIPIPIPFPKHAQQNNKVQNATVDEQQEHSSTENWTPIVEKLKF